MKSKCCDNCSRQSYCELAIAVNKFISMHDLVIEDTKASWIFTETICGINNMKIERQSWADAASIGISAKSGRGLHIFLGFTGWETAAIGIKLTMPFDFQIHFINFVLNIHDQAKSDKELEDEYGDEGD